MRPQEYKDELVIDAGKALRDSGRRITGVALRKLVGGGDPNRLRRVWDEHVAKGLSDQDESRAPLQAEVASCWEEGKAEISRLLENIVLSLNDVAVKAADVRAQEALVQANKTLAAMEAEITEAGLELEAAEQAMALITTGRDELKNQLETTIAEGHALRVELAEARERAANAQKQEQKLTGQLEAAQLRLEATQELERAASQRESAANAKIALLEDRHDDDQRVIADLQKELAQTRQDLEVSKRDLRSAMASSDEASRVANTAIQERSEAQRKTIEASERAAELSGQLKQLKEAIAAQRDVSPGAEHLPQMPAK